MSSVAVLAITNAASAATVTFDFGAATAGIHPLSVTTKDFTSNGLTITATGYSYQPVSTMTATAIALSQRGDTGDEHGLGLANDTANGEIKYQMGFVQLDLSNLYANHVQGVSISMGSTTNGEQWAIYGSNSAGSYSTANIVMESAPYANSGNVTGDPLQQFGAYTYYDVVEIGHTTTNPSVSATNDNVLIESVTATTAAPEPAAWSLMMIGVGGMGAALRSRRRRLAV